MDKPEDNLDGNSEDNLEDISEDNQEDNPENNSEDNPEDIPTSEGYLLYEKNYFRR